MRGLRSTLVLLVVFLGLGAYIYFVESKRSPEAADARPKAFDVEAQKIRSLRIKTDEGETAALEKKDEAWRLVEPVAAPADDSEVSSLTSSLASLEIQRVVDEKPADLAEFGLGEPRVDVTFTSEGETEPRRLQIGSRTATGGDLYARIGGESRVVLVASYLENTFNRKPFDLRDKSILKFDRAKVDRVEIATGSQAIALAKRDQEWDLVAPWKARADFNAVDSVISRLNTAEMQAITAETAGELRKYGLEKPRVTATVAAGSARATLLIGAEAEEGAVYARDAARPAVFTIESSLVDTLTKAPAEYRRKDLFDFRAFNATRFQITRGGRTLAFEKVQGEGENAGDVWRQVEPTAREVDRTKMEDVLSKFSNLRAESWADSRRGTGLDIPAAEVFVRFDEGKKEERVTFGRTGDEAFAVPAGEPGAARITAKDFDEALKALDALAPAT